LDFLDWSLEEALEAAEDDEDEDLREASIAGGRRKTHSSESKDDDEIADAEATSPAVDTMVKVDGCSAGVDTEPPTKTGSRVSFLTWAADEDEPARSRQAVDDRIDATDGLIEWNAEYTENQK
jgi:hypothetical protein